MYFVSKFNLDGKDGDHRDCNKFKVPMEFQSGQNCVTEIKDMLYAKYIETLCYIENIETSSAKCTNIMRKLHKCYAQNAEILCSKCRNVMLKIQKSYAQNRSL